MDRAGTPDKVGLRIGKHRQGQGLVEFALLLPILVLVVFGIFEIGRAFFTLVAITNAAREGARVYTIYPSQTTVTDIQAAAKREAGNQELGLSLRLSLR